MGYRSCLAPALALVGALLLHVHTASACDPNPCFDADLWETLQPVNAALIPSDGVLVLQGSNDGDAASWLEAIEVEVTLRGDPGRWGARGSGDRRGAGVAAGGAAAGGGARGEGERR
jgi:hypothetical protein